MKAKFLFLILFLVFLISHKILQATECKEYSAQFSLVIANIVELEDSCVIFFDFTKPHFYSPSRLCPLLYEDLNSKGMTVEKNVKPYCGYSIGEILHGIAVMLESGDIMYDK